MTHTITVVSIEDVKRITRAENQKNFRYLEDELTRLRLQVIDMERIIEKLFDTKRLLKK